MSQPLSDAIPRKAPDPLFHAVLLALSGGVLVLAMVLSIRNGKDVLIPVVNLPVPELCMMRRIGAMDCPGCGMTRCFIALVDGDLAGAWSYNPAGLFMFALVAGQVPFRAMQLWRIRRGLGELNPGALANVLIGALVVGMVGQWIVRLLF
jgi:hypothetical protein